VQALGGGRVNLGAGIWLRTSATPLTLSIVLRFVLGRRHIATGFEQAARVEPIDRGERREFDGLAMTPRSFP
jgi:hypothetical protein